MRAFRFKLERILSLRRHAERDWEIRLAGITGKCVSLRRDIEDRMERKAETMLQGSTRGASAEELLMKHRYMARLDQEAGKKHEELSESEQKREEVQAQYVEASKERKILDKLKEKRSATYIKHQRVEEAKQIDDINTGRASRPKGLSPPAESE
jgi:flagellar FliJ protein